jgi:DNA polymerase zeta
MATQKICASCSSTPTTERILCDSIDCPVLYTRTAANRDLEDLGEVRGILEKLRIDAEEKGEEGDLGEFAHAMDW